MKVESVSPAELHSLIVSRASMYAFLARMYREELDRAFLERLSGMDLAADSDDPELQQAQRLLQSCREHVTEASLTELAADYARVFLGVRRGMGAYPYESVYTSPQRLLMQEARGQVLRIYREEGLGRAEGFVEPEDHVAFEFEFMAYLCDKTAKALQAGDEDAARRGLDKQKRFLEDHLLRWVPAFCADVERVAETDLYRAVAKITAHFLDIEKDCVDQLCTELKA